MSSKQTNIVVVEISNWDRYQYRKGLKSMTWYRVMSTKNRNTKIRQLTLAQRGFLDWLLTEVASTYTSPNGECVPGLIRLCTHQTSRELRVKNQLILTCLSELERLQIVKCTFQHKVDTDACSKNTDLRPRQDNTTQHNINSNTNVLEEPSKKDDSQPTFSLDIIDPKKKAPTKRKKTTDSGRKAYVGIARYCELWKLHHGTNPTISPKDGGLIKNLSKSMGEQKLLKIIETYFGMPDVWFVKKAHDIPTMVSNLRQIESFMASGKVVTRQAMQKAEQKVEIAQTAYDFTANMTPQEKREYYSLFPGYDENGNKIEESETKMLEAR